MHSRLFLLLIFSAAAQGAIEVSDIRMGLGGYGVSQASWSESYSAGPWSNSDSGNDSGTGWDGSVCGAFSLIYTKGHLPYGGGFIWAAGFESTFESHRSTIMDFPDQPVNTDTFALVGRAGFGLPIGPRVHLECMPEVHFGGMVTDVYDSDGLVLERRSASGSYGAIGLHLGGYVTVDHHLVLGIAGGFRRVAGHYSANFVSTGGYDEGALYYTQWGGQFEIGIRF